MRPCGSAPRMPCDSWFVVDPSRAPRPGEEENPAGNRGPLGAPVVLPVLKSSENIKLRRRRQDIPIGAILLHGMPIRFTILGFVSRFSDSFHGGAAQLHEMNPAFAGPALRR